MTAQKQQERIPGYDYGGDAIATSPISMDEWEQLKRSALFSEEDVVYLRPSRDVLADQVQDLLGVWRGVIFDHLLRVDHAAIARACGAHGVTVGRAGDLNDALTAALSASRPALLDVPTDPGAHPPISLYDNTLDVVQDAKVTREPVP
jgi:hypothetical protein